MKKLILTFALAAMCACAFAVKLPDGKNVRSSAVTTYPSGALRTVELPYPLNRTNGIEIATPIGTMVVYGKICYYEDGSLKSCQPCQSEVNEALRVQTNMGELTGFTEDGSLETVSFYQSDALWSVCNARILGDEVKGLPFDKNQMTNCVFHFYKKGDVIELFAGAFSFYDSGRSDYAIVRTAKLGGGYYEGEISWLTFSTKAGDFQLWREVSFYRDGSIRECRAGEVMLETIYGKKVQIPRFGLLRFHKDGSVAAYATTLQTEYTVGSHTYTANKGGYVDYIGNADSESGFALRFNIVAVKNDGTVEQFLYDPAIDPSPFNSGSGPIQETVSAFYPSGAIWRVKETSYTLADELLQTNYTWYSEDGKYAAYTGDYNVLRSSRPVYRKDSLEIARENKEPLDYTLRWNNWGGNYKGKHNVYFVEDGSYWYAIVPHSVRNVYFGADGFPASYDCFKTVQNITLIQTPSEAQAQGRHYAETDELEEYGILHPPYRNDYALFLELDDDGNYIPDDTRHAVKMELYKEQ